MVYDIVGFLAVCARYGSVSFQWVKSDVGAVELWGLYGFSFIRRSVLQLVVSKGPLEPSLFGMPCWCNFFYIS